MKWSRKEFSSYDRWEFDFIYNGYPIHLVIKFQYRAFRDSYFTANWDTDLMRGTRYELLQGVRNNPRRQEEFVTAARRALFANLRTSLTYGLNIKARATINRLQGANGQTIPHKIYQISGRLR